MSVTVNVRGENNSIGSIANSKSTGNRVSASYIDQFGNGTVGVALGSPAPGVAGCRAASRPVMSPGNKPADLAFPGYPGHRRHEVAGRSGFTTSAICFMGVLESNPAKDLEQRAGRLQQQVPQGRHGQPV